LIWLLTSGLSMIIGGFLVIFLFQSLVEAIIVSKLPLLPGTDITNAWINPPVEPLLKIHFFNVTNPEEYLSGSVPQVQEVGPYTYQEKWVREEVDWTEDQTMVKFRMRKSYFYRPDLSDGNLEDQITVPNVPLFAMLNDMRARGPDMLLGANAFVKTLDPPQNVFETQSIRDLIWGYQHNLVDMANLILQGDKKLPELYGYFYGKNNSLGGEFLVNTGSEDIAKLGQVVKFNNRTTLSAWEDGDEKSECNSISGTDGSVFPPFVTEDTTLNIFNKDLCRSLPLQFSEKVNHHDLETLRFIPAKSAFSHQDNSCFCAGQSTCAPQGLFNVTECQGNAPMFLSWPHFYNADPELLKQVGGLNPSKEMNEFHVDILPDLGVGLRAAIRLQINVHMRADGVQKLENATSVYLPIIWFSDGIEEINDPETIDLLKSAITSPAIIRSILYPVLLVIGVLMVLVSLGILARKRRTEKIVT